jgi:hypothetical protein
MGIEDHRERIAAKGAVSEHVHGDVTSLHMASPVPARDQCPSSSADETGMSFRKLHRGHFHRLLRQSADDDSLIYPSRHTAIGWS